MYPALTVVPFLFLGALANATPVVNSAVLNDGKIVISGSSFGDHNPMLFWDSAEISFKQQKAKNEDVVLTSTKEIWRENTNQWGLPFLFKESSDSRSGFEDIFYYGTGHKNFLGKPDHPVVESLNNSIYVSWWYKPGKSPSDEGGANKFIRIWDNINGVGTRISWSHNVLGCNEHSTWGNWTGDIGQWNHHSIQVDLKKQFVRTWVNGVLIHDAKCIKHPDFKNTPLYVGLIGFDHGSSAYQKMTTAIDDIYIATSEARVEISNRGTWSAVMPKEVLPVSEWSNNRISVTPLRGVIKLSSDVFVYVVDSQGTVNKHGIKLDCKQCPKAVPAESH